MKSRLDMKDNSKCIMYYDLIANLNLKPMFRGH